MHIRDCLKSSTLAALAETVEELSGWGSSASRSTSACPWLQSAIRLLTCTPEAKFRDEDASGRVQVSLQYMQVLLSANEAFHWCTEHARPGLQT